MTIDIASIRARCDRATKGPWWNESGIVHCKAPEWTEQHHACDHPVKCERDEDAEFCAEARSDLPALLAEVERLRMRESEARWIIQEALKLKWVCWPVTAGLPCECSHCRAEKWLAGGHEG